MWALDICTSQVWATSQFPGHAAAAQQEECKEAERCPARPLQAFGQQLYCY